MLPSADAKSLTIGAGVLHVAGALCRNAQSLALEAQPDAPGVTLPAAVGRYLVYLDVWDQHVTALEDASLRDPALGGADTATRIRTIWQARVLPAAADAVGADYGPGWVPDGDASSGTLHAFTDPPVPSGTSVLPATAGYRGLSNQLYRVEIHQGGTLGGSPAPTFKWSRENGIVAARILAVAGQTLTLDDLGVAPLDFAAGQWIELVRPEDALDGVSGPLLAVESIDAAKGRLVIGATTPLPAWATTAAGLLARRWDQPGAGGDAAGVAVAAGPIVLEAGISVAFGAGNYRAGDYWTIPARTAISAETGNLLFPTDPQPARIVCHRYAPLALIDRTADGKAALVDDLRAGVPSRATPVQAYLSRGGPWEAAERGADVPLDTLAQGLLVAVPSRSTAIPVGTMRLVVEVPSPTTIAGTSVGATSPGTLALMLASDVIAMPDGLAMVRPRLIALELLLNLLSSGSGSSSALANNFTCIPSSGWSVNHDGSIVGTFPSTNGLAIVNAPVPGDITTLEIHAQQSWDYSGGAHFGLVFNYRSAKDYWVLSYDRSLGYSSTGSATDIITFSLDHFGSAYYARNYLYTSINDPLALTISMAPGGGLQFGYTINPGTSAAQTVPLIFVPGGGSAQDVPGRIEPNTQVGVLASGTPATITRLFWDRSGGPPGAPLPFGGRSSLAVSLVVDGLAARAPVQGSALPQRVAAAAVPNPVPARAPVQGSALPQRVAAAADWVLPLSVTAPLQSPYFNGYGSYGGQLIGFGSDLLDADGEHRG